ncbi:MAG: hypothetical protein F6J87_16660 [Spirulina sp. SIO3F2]|nr:hypothetical protein [Spirulina sp. SIO3F2]
MRCKHPALHTCSTVLALMGLSATGVTAQSLSESDWAYQALDDFVHRYDCLKDSSNSTFEHGRLLSRDEFVVDLNTCIHQMAQAMGEMATDCAVREDLATTERLIADFESELTALNPPLEVPEPQDTVVEDNSPESQDAAVEDNRDYPPSKGGGGEIIYAATSLLGDDALSNIQDESTTVTLYDDEQGFGYRVRLTLNPDFDPEAYASRLEARMQSRPNLEHLISVPNETTQSFMGADDRSEIDIDWLQYYFPANEDAQGNVVASGGIWSDFAANGELWNNFGLPVLPYFFDASQVCDE